MSRLKQLKQKGETAIRWGQRKLQWMEAFHAVSWIFLGILLGGMSFSLVSGGEIYEYIDSFDGVHPPPVDAIVCLAGGRGRISVAGDVWYRYWEQDHHAPGSLKIPTLYLSGMGPQSNFGTFSRQIRRGVRDVIRPEQVLIEIESTNTEENAEVFARVAKEKGWKRILLVTSRYHMRRSRFIFEGVLWKKELPMQIDTASVYQEPFEPDEWRHSLHGIQVTLNEYFKWLGYKTFWRP